MILKLAQVLALQAWAMPEPSALDRGLMDIKRFNNIDRYRGGYPVTNTYQFFMLIKPD